MFQEGGADVLHRRVGQLAQVDAAQHRADGGVQGLDRQTVGLDHGRLLACRASVDPIGAAMKTAAADCQPS